MSNQVLQRHTHVPHLQLFTEVDQDEGKTAKVCILRAHTHTHTRLRESLALGAGRQETRNQCIHLSPASSRARPAEGKGYRVTRKKNSELQNSKGRRGHKEQLKVNCTQEKHISAQPKPIPYPTSIKFNFHAPRPPTAGDRRSPEYGARRRPIKSGTDLVSPARTCTQSVSRRGD